MTLIRDSEFYRRRLKRRALEIGSMSSRLDRYKLMQDEDERNMTAQLKEEKRLQEACGSAKDGKK